MCTRAHAETPTIDGKHRSKIDKKHREKITDLPKRKRKIVWTYTKRIALKIQIDVHIMVDIFFRSEHTPFAFRNMESV